MQIVGDGRKMLEQIKLYVIADLLQLISSNNDADKRFFDLVKLGLSLNCSGDVEIF